MKKQAKDIQIGNTIKCPNYWLTVNVIEYIQQKNGKMRVKVTGKRHFRNTREEKILIAEHGNKVCTRSYSFGENTKVAYK